MKRLLIGCDGSECAKAALDDLARAKAVRRARDDPIASETMANPFGTRNAVLNVSPESM